MMRVEGGFYMNRIKPVPDFKTLAGLFLVPLVHQKEIADIPMLDTAPAHVKFVQRNNILREVVADGIISPKLPGNGFLRRKEIRHLNIQLLSAFAAWHHKSGRHSPGFACFWQGKITR